MEEHETRRKIIRQWMALPKDKRQTEEQVATFAKKAAQENEFASAAAAKKPLTGPRFPTLFTNSGPHLYFGVPASTVTLPPPQLLRQYYLKPRKHIPSQYLRETLPARSRHPLTHFRFAAQASASKRLPSAPVAAVCAAAAGGADARAITGAWSLGPKKPLANST
jgi:hypothetical protein